MVGPKFTIAILVCLGSVAYSVSAGKYYDDDNSSYESYEKPKSNSIFSSLRERVKKFFKLPEKLKGFGGGREGRRRKNKYENFYSYGPPPPPLPYHNGPPPPLHHNHLPSPLLPFSSSSSPYEASNSVGRFSAEFYDGGGDARRPILYPNHFHYQVQNEAYAPHYHHHHPDHYGYHGGSRGQREENKSADLSETEETKEDVSSSSLSSVSVVAKEEEEASPKSSKGKKKSPLGKDPKRRPSGKGSSAVGVKENESKEPQMRSKSKVSTGKVKISSSSKKSSRKRKKSSKKSKPDDSDEKKKKEKKKEKRRKAKRRSSESSEPEQDSLEPQNHHRRFQNLDGVRKFFKYGPRAFMRHRDSGEGAVRIARSTHYGRRDRDVEVITAAPLARQLSSREYLVGASMRATDKGVRRMKVKGIVMADTAHTDDDARGRRNVREEEKEDFNLMTMLKHMAKVK